MNFKDMMKDFDFGFCLTVTEKQANNLRCISENVNRLEVLKGDK